MWSKESNITKPNPNTSKYNFKKITFKRRRDSANSIYREFPILKFKGLIYLQNCIFMLQI